MVRLMATAQWGTVPEWVAVFVTGGAVVVAYFGLRSQLRQIALGGKLDVRFTTESTEQGMKLVVRNLGGRDAYIIGYGISDALTGAKVHHRAEARMLGSGPPLPHGLKPGASAEWTLDHEWLATDVLGGAADTFKREGATPGKVGDLGVYIELGTGDRLYAEICYPNRPPEPKRIR
jgi:hypothetical protein